MRGWSTVLLPDSANPPGANRASWPGNMVGTLWADKVLPGDRARHRREHTDTESGRAETETTDTETPSPETFTQTPPTWTNTQKTDRKSSQKFSSSEPDPRNTSTCTCNKQMTKHTHTHIYAHECIHTEKV